MKLKDLVVRLTSMRSTIMAVVSAILTVMVALKVVSDNALVDGLAVTGNLFDALLVILGSITSVSLLLSKDSKVIEKELSE